MFQNSVNVENLLQQSIVFVFVFNNTKTVHDIGIRRVSLRTQRERETTKYDMLWSIKYIDLCDRVTKMMARFRSPFEY